MKSFVVSAITVAAIVTAVPVWAHDTPNFEHSHAFRQTGYGTWRQGHSVNGPLGQIIIWSPQTYNEYQDSPPVRFARPQPITRPPGSALIKPRAGQNPALEYGKRRSGDYGN